MFAAAIQISKSLDTNPFPTRRFGAPDKQLMTEGVGTSFIIFRLTLPDRALRLRSGIENPSLARLPDPIK